MSYVVARRRGNRRQHNTELGEACRDDTHSSFPPDFACATERRFRSRSHLPPLASLVERCRWLTSCIKLIEIVSLVNTDLRDTTSWGHSGLAPRLLLCFQCFSGTHQLSSLGCYPYLPKYFLPHCIENSTAGRQQRGSDPESAHTYRRAITAEVLPPSQVVLSCHGDHDSLSLEEKRKGGSS